MSTTSSIPVVDFSAFLEGNDIGNADASGGQKENGMEKERERVAKQIDTAFQNAGFVYLTGHGVSADMVREAFTWSKTFFALPPATKMLAPHPPGGTHHRGYSSPGLEKVSQHTYSDVEIEKERQVPDYKESFESGNVNDIAQPNIWLPEQELPGFRPFMEEYFTVCAGLVHRVLHALSLALDVPAPGLGSTHAESLFQLRLLHYPAMPAEELRDHTRARINAHSDFGTLTLLFQDAVGGLEIEDPHAPGVFRAVPPVEDAVLVNVGDLLARWSNDRWRSSVHRVGLPGEGGGEMVPERYSIPFFATADMDTVIDALPGCWDEADPESKKYEPVTAWGYVQMRMAALYEG